jgi:hypothetical protein
MVFRQNFTENLKGVQVPSSKFQVSSFRFQVEKQILGAWNLKLGTLEKPNRVGKLHAATDFGREFFDEREMIAVFLVE